MWASEFIIQIGSVISSFANCSYWSLYDWAKGKKVVLNLLLGISLNIAKWNFAWWKKKETALTYKCERKRSFTLEFTLFNGLFIVKDHLPTIKHLGSKNLMIVFKGTNKGDIDNHHFLPAKLTLRVNLPLHTHLCSFQSWLHSSHSEDGATTLWSLGSYCFFWVSLTCFGLLVFCKTFPFSTVLGKL